MQRMTNDQHEFCVELQPVLAAYALGERELDAGLRAHLASCTHCQQTLREYKEIARVLPYAAPEIVPSPALRERILARATGEPATGTTADAGGSAPAHAAIAPRRQRAWPRLAFAGVLALALMGWNLWTQSRLSQQIEATNAERARLEVVESILSAPDTQSYSLSGTGASGQIWISDQRNQAYLVAQGLPEPAAGQVYQMWLIQGDAPVSAGTFEAGRAAAVIEVSGPLQNFGAFGVTIEPRGGSDAPTSPPILLGAIES